MVTTEELLAVDSAGVFASAIENSRRRPYGSSGSFTIARKDYKSESSALVAMAIAVHAAKGHGWEQAEAEQKSVNFSESLRIWEEETADSYYWGDD